MTKLLSRKLLVVVPFVASLATPALAGDPPAHDKKADEKKKDEKKTDEKKKDDHDHGHGKEEKK